MGRHLWTTYKKLQDLWNCTFHLQWRTPEKGYMGFAVAQTAALSKSGGFLSFFHFFFFSVFSSYLCKVNKFDCDFSIVIAKMCWFECVCAWRKFTCVEIWCNTQWKLWAFRCYCFGWHAWLWSQEKMCQRNWKIAVKMESLWGRGFKINPDQLSFFRVFCFSIYAIFLRYLESCFHLWVTF